MRAGRGPSRRQEPGGCSRAGEGSRKAPEAVSSLLLSAWWLCSWRRPLSASLQNTGLGDPSAACGEVLQPARSHQLPLSSLGLRDAVGREGRRGFRLLSMARSRGLGRPAGAAGGRSWALSGSRWLPAHCVFAPRSAERAPGEPAASRGQAVCSLCSPVEPHGPVC